MIHFDLEALVRLKQAVTLNIGKKNSFCLGRRLYSWSILSNPLARCFQGNT